MADEIPAILHHVSVGTNDFDKASAFYDSVLTTVGARRVMEFQGVVAYGKTFPEFWVHGPLDGQPAAVGNGTHFCFIAPSQEAVHAFYDAALAAGGVSDGEPGPRPDYGPDYSGAFVRDLDGHKIEAALATVT